MITTLDERVVIVTGASAGIGRELVRALYAEGAYIAFCGRNEAALAALSDELGGGARIFYQAFDIRDSGAIQRFIDMIHERYGRIDALINNAGVMYLGPISEVEIADWLEMIDINVKAPMALTAHVLPRMLERRSGDIINFSSISARILGPGVTVYSASKSAIDVFSEGLRRECAGSGVRVAAIQLGGVNTEINEKIRNLNMRKLIKMRAKTYHTLDVEDVCQTVVHMLKQPRNVSFASVFLVSADQAG